MDLLYFRLESNVSSSEQYLSEDLCFKNCKLDYKKLVCSDVRVHVSTISCKTYYGREGGGGAAVDKIDQLKVHPITVVNTATSRCCCIAETDSVLSDWSR